MPTLVHSRTLYVLSLDQYCTVCTRQFVLQFSCTAVGLQERKKRMTSTSILLVGHCDEVNYPLLSGVK